MKIFRDFQGFYRSPNKCPEISIITRGRGWISLYASINKRQKGRVEVTASSSTIRKIHETISIQKEWAERVEYSLEHNDCDVSSAAGEALFGVFSAREKKRNPEFICPFCPHIYIPALWKWKWDVYFCLTWVPAPVFSYGWMAVLLTLLKGTDFFFLGQLDIVVL